MNKDKGFTLIEVLVAGVILIVVISVMTFIYRTAVISSIKASDNVNISGSMELIVATIQSKIRSVNSTNEMSGKGVIDDVEYHWHTTLIANKGAPSSFESESGALVENKKNFYLWQVDLTLNSKSLIKDYQYNEISWRND